MSNNTPEKAPFTDENEHQNMPNTTESQQKLGSTGQNAYEEFSVQMNSTPADGLIAVYALGGLTPPTEQNDTRSTEDK